MTYLIAWGIYLAASATLVAVYYRHIEGLFPAAWGLVVRVLLLTLLFTPWVVQGADHHVVVPAFIASLFNMLAHDRGNALKPLIPILLINAMVCAVLLRRWQPELPRS